MLKSVRAIILAAGRGSRMKEATADIPKGLVLFRGKPLMWWQKCALKKAGITSISCVLGYKGQKIRDVFSDKIHFFENKQWAESNMLASLRCASAWLNKSRCVVSYSDIVYTESTVKVLIAQEEDIVITFDPYWQKQWSMRFNNPLSDAETFIVDSDGFLREIGGKTQEMKEIQGQYMGLFSLTPKGWRQIQNHLQKFQDTEIHKMDMTTLFREMVKHGSKIKVVPTPFPWCEIDQKSDLQVCEILFESVR